MNRPSTPTKTLLLAVLLSACRSDDEGLPPPVLTSAGVGETDEPPGAHDESSSSSSGPLGGESTSEEPDPSCEGFATYNCRGYALGVYANEVNQEDLEWDILDNRNVQCFDFNISACAPWSEGVDVSSSNEMTAAAAVACSEACDAMDFGWVPTISNGNPVGTWHLQSTECVFEVSGSQEVSADLGGGFHLCEGVTPGVPQLEVDGECTGGRNDPEECPVGSACGDWRPERWAYHAGESAVVDAAFFYSMDIGTMFSCDAKSFVYSTDPSGQSVIDGVEGRDLLDEIGLVDGDHGFKVRRTAPSPSAWYPLNTFEQIASAFTSVQLPQGSEGGFELEYVSAQGVPTTRTVKVTDCGRSCGRDDL